jgi:hypothetical protein
MLKFFAGLISGIILAAAAGVAAQTSAVRLLVDGREIIFPEAPPQIINNRVLVPARPLAEALGAKVEWDQATRSVIVKSKEMVNAMQNGSPRYIFWPTKVPGREKFISMSYYSPEALKEQYEEAPLQFVPVERPEGRYMRIIGFRGHYVEFPLFGGPEVQGVTDTGYTLRGVLVDGQLYVLPYLFSGSGITAEPPFDQGR